MIKKENSLGVVEYFLIFVSVVLSGPVGVKFDDLFYRETLTLA